MIFLTRVAIENLIKVFYFYQVLLFIEHTTKNNTNEILYTFKRYYQGGLSGLQTPIQTLFYSEAHCVGSNPSCINPVSGIHSLIFHLTITVVG